MVPWSDLVRDITLWLPDCPEPTMVNGLRRVAQDFYRDTWAWRSPMLELIPGAVAGQAVYAVASPDGTDIIGVHSAWLGSTELGVTPAGADEMPGWIGPDWTVGLADMSSVRLTPAPSLGGGVVRGVLALAPNSTAAGIPYHLWMEHRKALMALSISTLASQVDKPWGNAGLVSKFDAEGKSEQAKIAQRQGGRGGKRRPVLRVEPADWLGGKFGQLPLSTAVQAAIPSSSGTAALPLFVLPSGDAWQRQLVLQKADGSAYNITGRTVVASIYRTLAGASVASANVTVDSASGGLITVSIVEGVSASLQAGTSASDPSGVHWLVVRLDGPTSLDRQTLATIRIAVVSAGI